MRYCERQGITFRVEEPLVKDNFQGQKDYGDNFLSKLAKVQIKEEGEKHFEYDETHHNSHWVRFILQSPVARALRR